jgi:hypothetical protein
MTTLLQIIAIVFAIFVAGGWLLRLADIALDREDREKFKARVEKFWMETANIGFTAIDLPLSFSSTRS